MKKLLDKISLGASCNDKNAVTSNENSMKSLFIYGIFIAFSLDSFENRIS